MPGLWLCCVFSVHARFYRDMDWKKALVALMTGVLVSAYLGPEVASWMPAVREVSRWVLGGVSGYEGGGGFVALDVKGC